jgi:hypothetical protein
MRARLPTPRYARPSRRRAIASSIAAALLTADGSQLLAGPAVGAAPIRLLWPRCAPLCERGPAHGPRITAIYLSTEEHRGRATVTIDAFAANIRGQPVTGRLCYEAHHNPAEPGCVITATTRGRRIAAGVWWLHFRTPVYERYQISSNGSHSLVRPCWFGISIPVGQSSVEGSRHGTFHLASR